METDKESGNGDKESGKSDTDVKNSDKVDAEITDIGILTDIGLLPESNNNGKGKMKVKCAKCGILEEMKEDDVKLLAHVVRRCNSKPSPVDYLSVWSIIRGLCKDNDKHVFMFDESFDKEIADTIQEYNTAKENNNERKSTLDKVRNQIEETSNILKELEKEKAYAIAEVNAGEMLIGNIKLKFLKLTGSEDMSIWS
jgi:hypothetical protein